jgi:hypothetical protein
LRKFTDFFCRQSTEKTATPSDCVRTVDQSRESREAYVSEFLGAYLYPLMRIITAGVGEWTTDSRSVRTHTCYVITHTVSVHILCHYRHTMSVYRYRVMLSCLMILNIISYLVLSNYIISQYIVLNNVVLKSEINSPLHQYITSHHTTSHHTTSHHITSHLTTSPYPLTTSLHCTALSRWRHLKGLRVLLTLSGSGVALWSLLPPLLSCLSAPIRDEDTAVRLGKYMCRYKCTCLV